MTILQAYRAAYYFLDERYTQSPSNDLCDLVSGMPLLPDDTPADPAFKEDWNDAVRSITSKTDMSDAEAFAAMIVFMKNWAALGESGDISALIEDLLIQYATEEKATHWKEICKFQ